jgi:hypothetical protein
MISAENNREATMDLRRVLKRANRFGSAAIGIRLAFLFLGLPAAGAEPPDPVTRTDYDEGDWYLLRGDQKLPYHGMRDSWVFNRAMTWLDKRAGVDGAVLCYSTQSPLPLTGKSQVSRWYAGEGNEVADLDGVDEQLTRFKIGRAHV